MRTVDYETIITTLDEQRISVENDMNEFLGYEDYTLDEQRYDEGYANALLWASLTISRMMYKAREE